MELRYLAYIAGAIVLIYVLQIGRRMKGRLRFALKRIFIGMVVYIVGLKVGFDSRLPSYWPVALAFFAAIAVAHVVIRTPRISRRIPKSVRAAVIARDLKGEPFDGTKYHLDHIVPVSRGGDHSVENLRVVPKEKNLRKGDQLPGFRDLFGGR